MLNGDLTLLVKIDTIIQAEIIACSAWFRNLDKIVGISVLSFFKFKKYLPEISFKRWYQANVEHLCHMTDVCELNEGLFDAKMQSGIY